MKADLLSQLALTFATISLMAVGGGVVSVLPEMHRQIVDVHGWLDDATFANLFAIAQVAPGPNVLVVSLIGWHLAGAQGLLVATLGFLVPSGILASFASTLITRYEGTRILIAIKAGLVPVTMGLFAAGGVVLCHVADKDWTGLTFSLAGVAFALTLDRNPLWIMGGAALVGAVLGGT